MGHIMPYPSHDNDYQELFTLEPTNDPTTLFTYH